MFHVLLPVDSDSERANAAASAVIDLPRPSETVEVTVLHVLEEPDRTGGDGMRITAEDLYEAGEFPESVTGVVEQLETHDIEVETRQSVGEPADTIVEVAAELDVDRITLAGRKRTPVGKAVFGSVTQSVLRAADVPVTVTLDG